jgi:hypothetical protein
MQEKTKLFISMFQEGYTKKDVNFLVEYMDELFEDNQAINVIGTGNSEIFNSKDTVKALFEGDWLYWGDLKLKKETLIEKNVDNHKLFVIKCDLKYHFKEDDQTFERYREIIEEIIESTNADDVLHMEYQHMTAHYILDHFFHIREDSERTNDYPLDLVILCKEVEEKLKIRALTFTNPPNGEYPDERIHPYTGYDKFFEQAMKKLKKTGKKINLPPIFEMKKSEDFMFVDVDGLIYQSGEASKKYQERLNYYNAIDINENIGLVYEDFDLQAITLLGRVNKSIDENQARVNLHQRIKDILASDIDDLDKLFIIRREMSILNKETSLGKNHDWPFRVFVVFKKVNDDYVVDFIQFGYPMDIVLEDKYK